MHPRKNQQPRSEHLDFQGLLYEFTGWRRILPVSHASPDTAFPSPRVEHGDIYNSKALQALSTGTKTVFQSWIGKCNQCILPCHGPL